MRFTSSPESPVVSTRYSGAEQACASVSPSTTPRGFQPEIFLKPKHGLAGTVQIVAVDLARYNNRAYSAVLESASLHRRNRRTAAADIQRFPHCPAAGRGESAEDHAQSRTIKPFHVLHLSKDRYRYSIISGQPVENQIGLFGRVCNIVFHRLARQHQNTRASRGARSWRYPYTACRRPSRAARG